MKSPPVKNQNGKKWPQILAACAATFAVLSTGFHTGWAAPSLPELLSDEYPFEVSSDEGAYITMMGHLGNLFGGLFCTTIIDVIGRKKPILLIALPQLVSFFLIFMSYQLKWLLYVGRFIGGLSEAACFTMIPVYISEIAEPGIRGALGTLMSVAIYLGMFAVNMIGSYLSIKVTALIALVFPLVFLALFWKMPESPYYHLMKNQPEKAERVLQFLRGKANVGEELTRLTNDVNRQLSESGGYRDIFSIQSNRKAFFLMLGVRMCRQFSGISAFSNYIQIFLGEATQSLAPHIGASILLLIEGTMPMTLSLFVDKHGRRPLLLFSTAGCFLTLTAQGIYLGLKEFTDISLTAIDSFPLVMLVGFVIFFSMGLDPLANIIQGEIFSASIKSKAVSIINVAFALSMMSTTKFYQYTADEFGISVPMCSFAFCMFLALLFIYFCVPETKGKTLEEIQQELKGNNLPSKIELTSIT